MDERRGGRGGGRRDDGGRGRGGSQGGRPGGRPGGRDDSARRDDRRGGGPRDGGRRDDRRDNRSARPERAGAGRGEDDRGGSRLVPKEGRKPEPAIAPEVTGAELDRSVRQQLRTLSKENADGVAQHLVMVALLLEAEDMDGALAHAETAVRRAGRVPAAREALGFVAYRMGDYARALTEFRTVRRLSGSSHLLPLMVDCERGLGRPERALELLGSPEARSLGQEAQIELLIVGSGIRRDMGQAQSAVLALQGQVEKVTGKPWAARVWYAYADALLEVGRIDDARDWFSKAAVADQDGETDAVDRIDEIDGVLVEEVEEQDPRA
ncbi:tetratricopeptide repeat protein [Janibacter cremeus]|uniref:tetratricopeptide repeat protein n=1 Tax=Janibacter cremeus TaxID=1285192 RepID=UPI0023F69826|nr:tetratricopeptide repeat protein [Janibacter cremeus]WEV79290.1 tetratricopeptide repeat protein [Janibacter cremeus]